MVTWALIAIFLDKNFGGHHVFGIKIKIIIILNYPRNQMEEVCNTSMYYMESTYVLSKEDFVALHRSF